ncbi:hypothetical protein ACWGJP_08205 [Microbacterium sp. NPDC055903]
MISFSGGLWESLGSIGIALAVIAAIVGMVVWRGRRRGSRTIAIDAALTVSSWWLLLSALGAVFVIVKVFAVDWAELNGATSVWIPWSDALPCSEFGAAGAITCRDENLSEFTVGGASLGLRALAGAAQLSQLAFTTAPAAMLAVICFQTLRGRPFSKTITKVLTIGAAGVLLLGITAELLGSVAATVALREVFPEDSEWYPWGFQLTVTPLPFVCALGLAALAAVFRQGLALQAERDRLQRDTEGLV